MRSSCRLFAALSMTPALLFATTCADDPGPDPALDEPVQESRTIQGVFETASGDYERDARAFLVRHAEPLGLARDLHGLHLAREVATPGGQVLRYQQFHQGVRVFGGELVVGFDPGNRIIHVTSKARPLRDIPAEPRIDPAAAVSLAEATLDLVIPGDTAPPELVVVRGDKHHPGHHLAWLLDVRLRMPVVGAWFVFIDARDGALVRIIDRIKHTGPECVSCDPVADAPDCGLLFFEHPVDSANDPGLMDTDNVDGYQLGCELHNLTSGTRLTGSYVDTSITSPRFGPPYDYPRSANQLAVDEVNCYFHLNRAKEYLDAMGFTGVMNFPIDVDANDSAAGDNSYYDPSAVELHFGEGGVDDGQDGDIVYHEYGHAIQDDQVANFGLTDEGGAMGEGFGDYWAAALTDLMSAEPDLGVGCVGAWDATAYNPYDGSFGSGCLRRVDHAWFYPRDLRFEVHDDGEIWSAALWHLRSLVGATVADRLVIQGHFYLTSAAIFIDGADALISADQALHGGANAQDVHDAMKAYGLPRTGTPASSTGLDQSVAWVCESNHDYQNHEYLECSYTQPGATRLRFHFSRFETESGYDFAYISDADYNQVQALSGNQGASYTAAVSGDTILLRFKADYSVREWGFRIDQVEYRAGCVDASDCVDGNPCTQDICAAGSCTNPDEPAGTSCGDPSDTVCDDPDSCDGAGACQPNLEPPTTECRAAAGDCDKAEFCDGAGACPADTYEPAGTPCGDPSDTDCDDPDTCNAVGTCLPNFEPGTTVCRPDTGDCDVAETCDGAGDCPANAYEPAGIACGDPADTACDDPDSCDAAGSCLPNHEPATTLCRPDAGDCDVAESCDGSGNCPADTFEPPGTACGDSSDTACDDPDSCNASGTCLPNFEPATTLCRQDSGDCDVAESCDGAGSCPADGYEAPGTACGNPADTACDNPDSCNPSGSCLPNHEPPTSVCRADAGDCDIAENCDGAGTCPPDALEPAGTPCGSTADSACDNPDSCDTGGTCRPNHEPSSTLCRPDAGACDLAELCDGAGSCPADGFEPEGTPCDDGDLCTQTDTCQAGTCIGVDPVVCTNGDQCNDPGICDPSSGDCSSPFPRPNGTGCDDGDLCTQTDTCQAGACSGNDPVMCTPLDTCHLAGTCDPGTGMCSNPNRPDGTACDDADLCTGTDTCQAGVCTGSDPVVCTPLSQCHNAGVCDPASGNCSNPVVPDGTACDDAAWCTLGETCQAGACGAGAARDCDDADPCTSDSCDEANDACGHQLTPNPGAEGPPGDATCGDSLDNDCDLDIDLADADCLDCAADADCDDGNPCTLNSCTGGLCVLDLVASGTACDDGLYCTESDACGDGVCSGAARDCSHLDDACNLGVCNDTTDACELQVLADGTQCEDGSNCTLTDTCLSGNCVGVDIIVCAPLSQCHDTGTCDPATGVCTDPVRPDGTTCNDADACTQVDTCQGGTCTGADPVVCTPLDACHQVGQCNPANGRCSHPEAPEGTFCDDNNVCTQTATCEAGLCIGANPVPCEAPDECHQSGICDPVDGCLFPARADGTPCTGGTCQDGVCAPEPDGGVDGGQTDAGPDGAADADPDGGGTDAGADATTDAGPDAGQLPDQDDPGSSDGCGCSTRDPGPGPVLLVLVGLLCLVRRRSD